MSRGEALQHDVKTALVLSLAFGISGAAVVPFLVAVLPEGARSLPLPLPIFSLVLAVVLSLVYGAAALAGLRMARGRRLEPAPLLDSLWAGAGFGPAWRPLLGAFAVGLLAGLLLSVAVAMIAAVVPASLPRMLHPPTFGGALLASVAASFGEEILYRLFLLSLLLRIFPASRVWTTTAIILSALAFAGGHAPAMLALFGGLENVPSISWIWLIALNGPLGVIYGICFVRAGIGAAIAAHLGTDLVWHVASPLGLT